MSTSLLAIAHNAIVDGCRQQRDDSPFETASGLPNPRPTPEETSLTTEARRHVTDVLARLPKEQRQIVQLRLAGLTGPEMADGERPVPEVSEGGADKTTTEGDGTDANIAQVRGVARMLAAPINEGDAASRFALYSDGYVRRARQAGQPVPEAIGPNAARVPPPASEPV